MCNGSKQILRSVVEHKRRYLCLPTALHIETWSRCSSDLEIPVQSHTVAYFVFAQEKKKENIIKFNLFLSFFNHGIHFKWLLLSTR